MASVSVSVCTGDSYTFPDGSVLNSITSSNTHSSHFVSAGGCDSTINTIISVNPTRNLAVSAGVCSGNSYTFPDGSIQYGVVSATTQTSYLQSALGCDSIVVTTLSVNPSYNIAVTALVCFGGSYTFPDGTTETGITAGRSMNTVSGNENGVGQSHINRSHPQQSYLHTAQGCDSIISTSIKLIYPSVNAPVSDSVCFGSSYTFSDGYTQDTISSTIVHTSQFTNAAGCDSSIVTTVFVRPGQSTAVTALVCSGSSYLFPDGTTRDTINSTTVQFSHFQVGGNCDSVVVTTLYVIPVNSLAVSASVCSGGSYTFPDGSIQSGITSVFTQTSHFQSAAGCDSAVVTTVSVLPSYNLAQTVSVCQGGSYTFPDGTTQYNIMNDRTVSNNGNETGLSHITKSFPQVSYLHTAAGCDSIITTSIHVLYPSVNAPVSDSVCSGSSYTFADGFRQDTLTSTFVHTSQYVNAAGCDSSIVTTVYIRAANIQAISASVCSGSSYTFPDGMFQDTIHAGFVHTSRFQSAAGCDSTIVTTVSVIPVSIQYVSASVCSGSSFTFPDGSTQTSLTSSAVYTSHFISAAGCDSTIVTTVSVIPVSIQYVSASVCSGSSYTFPDGSTQASLTSTAVYTSHLTSAMGCDSAIVTTVTVNPVYNLSVSAAVCSGDSYTFPDGSMQDNIKAALVYTSHLQSISGCDSTVSTTLTINALPVVTIISSAKVVCAGSNVTLSGAGASTYSWSGGIQDAQAFVPASSMSYNLTGTDANNCKNTASVSIKVNALPVISYVSDFADSLCVYAGLQHLAYASPAGGIYTGAGVSGTTFNPSVAGVGKHMITYSYSDANTCVGSMVDSVVVVPAILTGLNEKASPVQLSVYPNPTVDQITISSSQVLDLMSIYNSAGALVYQIKSETEKQSIDLKTLSSGIYILEVQGKHIRVVKN